MITDPQERTIVSSLGWVDGGALWCLDISSERHRTINIGSGKYISLHMGGAGYFSAVHHFDADRLEITAHGFEQPEEILSRCVVAREERRIEGNVAVWGNLPRHYVAYLVQPAWSDFALIQVSRNNGLSLQTFDWYDDRYDKGYQGIIGVTEVPGSDLVIVSVQRSSKPIFYDPTARQKVGEIILSGGTGNPSLCFRRAASELWVDDYDTILKLEPESWRVLKRRKLQPAAAGTAQFIGQFTFDGEEKVCAVARPFSGDVVGLNPKSLRIRYRAKLGKQPLEVAVLRDHRVFARDWKTGEFLQGTLRRVWAP